MSIQKIKERLQSKSIFHSEGMINNCPTVIGYEKEFRWKWMATQLNTFVVASDLSDTVVTEETIEEFLTSAFKYAQKNYTGWPRGFQSGLGVITILLSKKISEGSIAYCRESKSGKKWAGFSVPVIVDTATYKVYSFKRNPMWGRIYYPYFREIVNELIS